MQEIHSCPTYTANIYVGLREGYSNKIAFEGETYRICQEYCNKVGLCVTHTDTQFIYKDGNEPGVIIGLINYPRFPTTKDLLRERALELAAKLKEALKQIRVSVVMSDETIMLGEL